MKDAEKIINDYIEQFRELPPRVVTIDYYSDFYLDLMEKAVETGEEITREVLDGALEEIPYDLVQEDTKRTPFNEDITLEELLKHSLERIKDYYEEYRKDKEDTQADGICFGLYIATSVIKNDLSTLGLLEDEEIKEMFGLPNIDYVEDIRIKPETDEHPKFTTWKNPHEN